MVKRIYNIISELQIDEFRNWKLEIILKHFLSALEEEAKECINIYLERRGVNKHLKAVQKVLKERFRDKNKATRNFNEAFKMKQTTSI